MRASAWRIGVAACFVVACGSRSSLLDASASGGSGGGTGASIGTGASGGMGASGGIGGAIGGRGGFGAGGAGASGGIGATGGVAGAGGSTCYGLDLASPIASVGDAADASGIPKLAVSSDDGQSVSVVYRRQKTWAGPYELAHATLQPWQAWPASGIVGPSYTSFVGPVVSADYFAADGYGGHLAVTYTGDPSNAVFAPSLDPQASGTGPVQEFGSLFPLFLERGEDHRFLLGWTLFSERNVYRLKLDSKGNVNLDTIFLSCTKGAFAATAYDGGWLIAYANPPDVPWYQPSCGAPSSLPESRIDVVWLGPNAEQPEQWSSLDTGAPVYEIQMAPHPNGAHVLYRGYGPDRIHWMRVSEGGGVKGPSTFGSSSDAPQSSFAVAAAGPNLFLAWTNGPYLEVPALVVSALDETGSELARVPVAGFAEPSVVASPDGASAVVSWSTSGGVQLALINCVGVP